MILLMCYFLGSGYDVFVWFCSLGMMYFFLEMKCGNFEMYLCGFVHWVFEDDTEFNWDCYLN